MNRANVDKKTCTRARTVPRIAWPYPKDIILALVAQLGENGILVVPVGNRDKQLMVKLTKKKGTLIKEEFDFFSFVPLLGEQGWKS